MRSISFALTERQLADGTKTVTRRLGWAGLAPGARLRAVRKAMGLKKGEKAVVLGEVVVASVRRERLDAVTADDVAREGFPGLAPEAFVAFFCRHMRCEPGREVTRIEFIFTPAGRDERAPPASRETGGACPDHGREDAVKV